MVVECEVGVIKNEDLLWNCCDYVFFVNFVFYDDLKIVVCVVVEYGGGGFKVVVFIVCDIML